MVWRLLVPGSSISPRHVRPCDVETESPWKTPPPDAVDSNSRRTHPCAVLTTADRGIQDLTGAVIYDCRPRILPVSIQLKDIGRSGEGDHDDR